MILPYPTSRYGMHLRVKLSMENFTKHFLNHLGHIFVGPTMNSIALSCHRQPLRKFNYIRRLNFNRVLKRSKELPKIPSHPFPLHLHHHLNYRRMTLSYSIPSHLELKVSQVNLLFLDILIDWVNLLSLPNPSSKQKR